MTNIEVRSATSADYAAYARLFPELGVDDPLPSQARFASDLAARTLIAHAGDAIVGYALVEDMDGVGYIRNVVSDPAHRGRGIGRALMRAAHARFVAARASRWCLNVKVDNAVARGLYESCGLHVAYPTTVLRIPRESTLITSTAHALVSVDPSDDAVLLARFALLPGQFASARTRGRDVLALVHAGDIVGVGVVLAAVYGAFPFRMLGRGHVAAFVAGMRERLPDAPYIQLSVDGDTELRSEVLELGASVALEIVHMTGDV